MLQGSVNATGHLVSNHITFKTKGRRSVCSTISLLLSDIDHQLSSCVHHMLLPIAPSVCHASTEVLFWYSQTYLHFCTRTLPVCRALTSLFVLCIATNGCSRAWFNVCQKNLRSLCSHEVQIAGGIARLCMDDHTYNLFASNPKICLLNHY